jgi:L-ascorbate metabolism protein UlaG (beta-lactamase superfamily)
MQPPNYKNLKHFLKLSIGTFALACRTNSGTNLNSIADIILILYEQEGVQISWTGHDGFRIKGTNNQNNQLTVYIDPYQLASKYQNRNDADVVLITHDHFDHLSIDDLKQIININTSIISATECVEKLAELKLKEIRGLKPGEKTTIKGLTIEAVPAYNTNKKFHPKSDGKVGFAFSINEKRIYHAGDTDLIPEMESVVGPDIALVPVSGTYVMNAEEAASAVNELLRPRKVAIPMHYNAIVGTEEDANKFKNLVKVCKVEILSKD